MYFNYHAKVKKMIENGEAIEYEFLENYHNISPCLLIHFINNKSMPIRMNKFNEYLILLAKNGVIEKK